MPRIERSYWHLAKSGRVLGSRCFNVDKPVGHGQANLYGDVYLVQALINFLMDVPGEFNSMHYGSLKRPMVDGRFSKEMNDVIRQYQGLLGGLNVLSQDGSIHPAKFSGRVLETGGKQMTIVQLNEDIFVATKGANYINAVLERYPILQVMTVDYTAGQPEDILANDMLRPDI